MSPYWGHRHRVKLLILIISQSLPEVFWFVPFPAWVSPAAPSRWRCPAGRRSEPSPTHTTNRERTGEHTWGVRPGEEEPTAGRCHPLTSFLFSLCSTFLLRGTSFLLKDKHNVRWNQSIDYQNSWSGLWGPGLSGLTVSSGPVYACGSGTVWSWWTSVYTCVWWSEASRSGSHRSAPEPSHSSYWASPAPGVELVKVIIKIYTRLWQPWWWCHHTCGCWLAQTHLFPHFGRKSCSLDHLHVEEALTCRGHRRHSTWTKAIDWLFNWLIDWLVSPFSSLMVAYWLLARGHDERLHNPVMLNSLRQKFWLFVLERERERGRGYLDDVMLCVLHHLWREQLMSSHPLTWLWRSRTVCFL